VTARGCVASRCNVRPSKGPFYKLSLSSAPVKPNRVLRHTLVLLDMKTTTIKSTYTSETSTMHLTRDAKSQKHKLTSIIIDGEI
jgi:hypothetical protein